MHHPKDQPLCLVDWTPRVININFCYPSRGQTTLVLTICFLSPGAHPQMAWCVWETLWGTPTKRRWQVDLARPGPTPIEQADINHDTDGSMTGPLFHGLWNNPYITGYSISSSIWVPGSLPNTTFGSLPNTAISGHFQTPFKDHFQTHV